jgi:hypothetical protein
MRSSRLTACVLLALMAGCARNAPALPPDLGHLPAGQRLLLGDAESPEGKMDCPVLQQEAAQSRAQIRQYEGVILSNRGHNQAVGYIGGVLFTPLLLAAKNDDEAKKNLDQLQAKADRIDRLVKAKGCPATPQ